MSNIGKITLVVPVVVGVCLAATLYFGVVFGVSDWLAGETGHDRYAYLLGLHAGQLGAVMGLVCGLIWVLPVGIGASRQDGKPAWVSRVIALLVVACIALFIYGSGGDAIASLGAYHKVGYFALVIFFFTTRQILFDDKA